MSSGLLHNLRLFKQPTALVRFYESTGISDLGISVATNLLFPEIVTTQGIVVVVTSHLVKALLHSAPGGIVGHLEVGR